MLLQKKKKVPTKNYFIISGIYIIVIIGILYLASWYNTYQDYQNHIPVLQGIISEIKPEEVDHFLMENPSCILYLCSASDNNCRSFETKFKKEILKNEWQDSLTYLNLSSVTDKTQYMNTFTNKYSTADFFVNRLPALIVLEDGKITSTIFGINGNSLTLNEVKQFMNIYQTGM